MKTPQAKKRFVLALCGLLLAAEATLQANEIQTLDASIPSSVISTGSGKVASWTDQSASANHSVSSSGTVSFSSSPVFPTNLPGLGFGPGRSSLSLFSGTASRNWLDQSAGSGGFCVMVAFKCNSIINEWNDLIGNSSAAGSGFGMRFGSGGSMVAYLGGVSMMKTGFALNGNDSIVFAFNYNATLDAAEFWDSKNYSSVYGSVRHADFSLVKAVTLGSMDNLGRYFNGFVGEVRVFDQPLSVSEFKAEREALALKWAGIPVSVPIQWRVIEEDPNYPEDEAIVAGVVLGDPGFSNPLPANPALEDCTATFQEAMKAMCAAGGGTVYVPPGHYRLDGYLTIPDGVILRGRWFEPGPNQPVVGTILDVYTGQGGTESDPAFLTGGGDECGIRGLTFWYPMQLSGSITPYSFTVANNSGMTTIENITLVNSYRGMNLAKSAFECLRGVYGTTLAKGIFIDAGYALPRFDEIHLSPAYWAWSGLPNSPTPDGAHAAFMLANATGIEIGRADGSYTQNITLEGFNYGIRFAKNALNENAGAAEFFNVHATGCNEALRLDSVGALRAFSCTFSGNQNGVHRVLDSNADFYGCCISGSNAAMMAEPGGLSFTLSVQSCTLSGPVTAGSSASLQLINSSFSGTGTNVILNSGVRKAIIAGCPNAGPGNIINNSGADASSVVLSSTPLAANPFPSVPTTYSKTRKPTKLDLFLVTGTQFAGGAKANGYDDDTAPIQAAIAAAEANGGGIVFFPAGFYKVTAPLTLNSGIELRGIFGGRHGNDNLGSLIQISTGAGNANGTPFITLGDRCGVRGLNFNYANQAWLLSQQVPYPYLIRCQGASNYVVDCCCGNLFQGVDLNGATEALVEYCFFGGLSNTYRVRGGSTDCRIQNTHIKPASWWISGMPKDIEVPKLSITQSQDVILAEDCSNLTLSSIFNHGSHTLFRNRGATGQAIFIGGEAIQRGFVMEVAAATGAFHFIGGDCNTSQLGDGTGSYSWWLQPTYTGTVSVWGQLILDSQCDYMVRVDNPLARFIGNDLSSGQERGIFGIHTVGEVVIRNSSLYERFNLVVPMGGKFIVSESILPPMSNQAQGGQTSYSNCIISNTYIAADTNEAIARPLGITMDTSNTAPILANIFPGVGSTRNPLTKTTRYGWHLTSGSTFRFKVTDPHFANGVNPNVRIELKYLEDTNGTLTLAYDGLNGRVQRTPFTLSASTATWRSQSFAVSDARFASPDGADITLTTSGTADPVLVYMVVQSNYLGTPAQLPPLAITTPSALTTGTVNTSYAQTLAASGGDSNYQWALVSGSLPNGLLLGSTGVLSGTPAVTGTFFFMVKVTDSLGSLAAQSFSLVTQDTALNQWRTTFFSTEELSESQISGPAADPDRDGRSNLFEYLAGTHPRLAVAGPGPTLTSMIIDGTKYPVLQWRQRTGIQDVLATVQVSFNLVTWSSGPDQVTPVDITPAEEGFEIVRVRANQPMSSRLFLRLQLAQVP